MKFVKNAIIRETGESACPFGLDIPDGCNNAGDMVNNMRSLENVKNNNDRAIIIDSNKRVLIFTGDKPCKCKYANHIMDDKVECNYGDNAAGLGNAPIASPPPLATYFNGGFFTVPLGPVGNYNENISYDSLRGLSNIYGSEEKEPDEIVKK